MSDQNREDSVVEQVADNVSSAVLWVFSGPWILIGLIMFVTGEAMTTKAGGLLFAGAGAALAPPFIKWLYAEYAARGEQPVSQGWLRLGYVLLIVLGFTVSTWS
ncbi:hypothetical protein [Maricurvus nonylphenolicus]|uniref:hypothetical protein n=1 Tax=Maricurvus nonylphenolicus TaxID=1008307 RepID=UPI0036F2D642